MPHLTKERHQCNGKKRVASKFGILEEGLVLSQNLRNGNGEVKGKSRDLLSDNLYFRQVHLQFKPKELQAKVLKPYNLIYF